VTFRHISSRLIVCLPLVLSMAPSRALCASPPSPSSTTLTISPPSAGHAHVSLTARVTSNGKPVAPGLVIFCRATAKYCQDTAVLGQAQLTSAGTATLHLILPVGTYNIRAVFHGTNIVAGSNSATRDVTVIGRFATATTASTAGGPGNYSFTGTVTSFGHPDPTGEVSFKDEADRDSPLAHARLGPATSGFAIVDANSSPVQTPGVAADFNGDGRLDQAVLNAEGGISVLLGNGDGTFTMKSSPAVGNDPYAKAVGDFNGDDIPDLAVANNSDSTVSILLGKGDGTFTAADSPATPIYPEGIAAGDFNGDGNVDLVVGGYTNELQILFGNGDGTFTHGSAIQANRILGPTAIAISDFNGDGKADLVVASLAGISLFLGSSDGTLTAAAPLPVVCDDACPGVAVADFNHDGKPDLAVADRGELDNYVGAVYILLGNGDGTFTPGGNTAPEYAVYVAVGDFNGGIVDLVVGQNQYSSTDVYLGAQDGTFIRQPVTNTTSFFLPGDFNGDGRTDLVLATGFNPSSLTTASRRRLHPRQQAISPLKAIPESSPFSHNIRETRNTGAAGQPRFHYRAQESQLQLLCMYWHLPEGPGRRLYI
jgi:FG-GAP-like repeat/Bacterial Ig-like domain (group 3)